jgi:HEAT repeat protein
MRTSLLTFLGAFVFRISAVASGAEPEHNGKKLGSWVKEFRQLGNLENRQHAHDAIRQIGTNALPFLLEETSSLGAAWKAGLTNFTTSATILERAMNVRAGFEALGGIAMPAFEHLTRLINSDGYYADTAAYALTQIDPQRAAPVLAGLIKTNQSNFIRCAAINNLFFVGTNSGVAVPSLLSCLDENETSKEARDLRRPAVGALGNVAQHRDTVIPRLAEVLKADEFWAVRAKAAKTLGALSNASAPALPALRMAATNDVNERVRTTCASAIKKIEPVPQ